MKTLKLPRLGKFARFILYLVLVLGLLAVVYALWVPDYVRSAYVASEHGHPLVSFIDHTRHDLDYYLQRASLIFWQYLFFGLPLTILAWRGIFRLYRWLLVKSEEQTPALLASFTFRYDWLIAVALYLLLTLLYFAPGLGQFSTHIIGPAEDNLGGYWNLWYANEMVVRGSESLTWTDYLYFPEGTSMYYFAWSFYNFGISSILWLLMSPAAVFNVIILHTFPLAGLGAFLLVRKVTGNSLVAILGGFIFAFSPNHFARALHHGNLNAIQFFPFFLLYFMNAIREGGKKHLLPAALFFFLNSMTDWNYMILALYLIAFGYGYLAIKRRQWILRDYLVKSAIIVGATLVIASPWLVPMVKIGLAQGEVNGGGRNTFVVDLLGAVTPGIHHWSGSAPGISLINESYTGNAWESAAYLGLVAIIIAVVAFRRTLSVLAKWWLGLASFLIMSLGPQVHLFAKSLPLALPYTLIAYVPFLSNVRAPGRFMVLVYLFWAVIVSFSVLKLWMTAKKPLVRAAVVVLLPGLLTLDYVSVCRDYTKIGAPTALAALRSASGDFGLLNLPFGYVNSMHNMMEQTIHRLPIVDGAATRKVGKSLVDRLELEDLSRQQQQLIDARVKYIAVHPRYPGAEAVDLDKYRASYELISEDNDCIIFRVY